LHQDGSIFTVNLEVLRLHKDTREDFENKMYSLQIKRVEGNHAPVTPPVVEVVGVYILGHVLSRTGAGVVRVGVHRQSGDTVAIKILNKKHLTQSELQRVRREIEINMQLNHPNVCKLLEVIDKPEALYLVMEYCDGGDLLAKMHEGQAQSKINAAVHAGEVLEVVLGPPLSEKEAHRIFCQLISAVQHCHSRAIVHRDIKHKNILFDKAGNVKLIDFGLGNWTLPGAMSFCGTPAYAAPEMLLGVQYMGPEVDIWSMGVVLFSLVTGKLPFLNVVDMVIGQLTVPRSVSVDCANLITRMLVVEVAQRATMNEILQHPWFTHNDDDTPTADLPSSGLSIDLTQPLSFTSSSLFTFDCPSPPLASVPSSPTKAPGNL